MHRGRPRRATDDRRHRRPHACRARAGAAAPVARAKARIARVPEGPHRGRRVRALAGAARRARRQGWPFADAADGRIARKATGWDFALASIAVIPQAGRAERHGGPRNRAACLEAVRGVARLLGRLAAPGGGGGSSRGCRVPQARSKGLQRLPKAVGGLPFAVIACVTLTRCLAKGASNVCRARELGEDSGHHAGSSKRKCKGASPRVADSRTTGRERARVTRMTSGNRTVRRAARRAGLPLNGRRPGNISSRLSIPDCRVRMEGGRLRKSCG